MQQCTGFSPEARLLYVLSAVVDLYKPQHTTASITLSQAAHIIDYKSILN